MSEEEDTREGLSIPPRRTAKPGELVIPATSAWIAPVGVKGLTASMTFSEPEEEAEPAELVLLPQKVPQRVLVAFFEGEGDAEPFWAAYLSPQDVDTFVDPRSLEDATMSLKLSLVKRFKQ